MSIKIKIINLNKINWKDHILEEGKFARDIYTFAGCIENNQIEIGDMAEIKSQDECDYDLYENEYSIVFDKILEDGTRFLVEEPFTLEECKILFGFDFE